MKIIIVDLLLIGDIVNAAHVAVALKKHYKEATIDILTYKNNQEVTKIFSCFTKGFYLDRNKFFEECINSDVSVLKKIDFINSELKSLMEEEYDLAINFTNNKMCSIICSLITAKEKIGAVLEENKILTIKGKNPWIKYFNDFVTGNYYNSFQYVDVFKRALEVYGPAKKNSILDKTSCQKQYERKYFALKITTSEVNKNWGEEQYIEVAKGIISKTGYDCLLLGVEKEKKQLEIIKEKIGKQAKTGLYSFNELVSVLGEAEIVIGGDTGILHLAAALNTKTVTIAIGPGTYFKSTPYGSDNIILYPKEPCYPCKHLATCRFGVKCRFNIRPKDVINSIFKRTFCNPDCGGVLTYFDKDGFLSYKNINSAIEERVYSGYLETRSVLKKYLNNRTLKEYDFKELENILIDKQGYSYEKMY